MQGVSNLIQAAHLSENGKFVTLDDFGIGLNSIGKKQITFTTKTLDATAQRVQISWLNSVAGETYEVKNFVVEELDPLPTITTGTKYLECTSTGTIKINHNTTTDADASIDYYDGASWTTFSGKLSDLITTHAWLSKEGNYLEFSLTSGKAIAKIKIYDGVRQ